ncbi:MAG: hypothetical protein J2P29_05880 [Actinobacteria bacterium]|nr:hypothetical protein [Actinomycetota bacterium]MBO0831483.1 hypothetical protein [Actinomycetota bacterium]
MTRSRERQLTTYGNAAANMSAAAYDGNGVRAVSAATAALAPSTPSLARR